MPIWAPLIFGVAFFLISAAMLNNLDTGSPFKILKGYKIRFWALSTSCGLSAAAVLYVVAYPFY